MVQILYSIAAIAILGLAILNVNIKIHSAEERMMSNELAFEMTSVGAEVLNEIGKHEFDPGTISGMVVTTDSLRLDTNFGSGGCDPDNNYQSCYAVGDFHGKTATRNMTRVHGGTSYTVTYNVTGINVQYVSESSPHAPTTDSTPEARRTFAKKVTLTVSTPTLVDADGDPLEVEMSRVYMYPSI